MRIAYCVLRIGWSAVGAIVYCVLRIAYWTDGCGCELRIAYCVLRIAYCVLRPCWTLLGNLPICVLRIAYPYCVFRPWGLMCVAIGLVPKLIGCKMCQWYGKSTVYSYRGRTHASVVAPATIPGHPIARGPLFMRPVPWASSRCQN